MASHGFFGIRKGSGFFCEGNIILRLWKPWAVFLVGTVFSPCFFAVFSTPKRAIFYACVLLGCLLIAVRAGRRRQVDFLPSVPAGFAFLFLLRVLFQESYSAWSAHLKTLDYLAWGLFMLLSGFEKGEGCPGGFRVPSLSILEMAGVPVAGYGFAQHFNLDPIRWTPGGARVFSTLGNADAMANFLAVLLALSFVRFLAQAGLLRFILIEAEWCVLFWSYSRGPFLALAVGGLALFFFAVRRKSLRRVLPKMLTLQAACLGTLLLLFFAKGQAVEKRRFAPASWTNDHNIIGRRYLFHQGLELLFLHPSGVGPGNFSYAYLKLRRNAPPFYRSGLARAESTHNTFLDVWIETGWAGGICFLFVWLAAFWGMALTFKNAAQEETLLGFSFFIPLLVAFVSLQFMYPDAALEALTGYLLGAASTLAPLKIVKWNFSKPFAIFASTSAAVLVVLGFVCSARMVVADLYAGSGSREVNQGVLDQAIWNFSRATAWNPWDPLYFQKLGKSYEMRGSSGLALANYNKAAALNGQDPLIWADIGRLAALNHWRRRALTAYVRAVQLDPYNDALYHDGALTALSLRAYPLALYFAREAFRLNPHDPSNTLLLARALSNRRAKAP